MGPSNIRVCSCTPTCHWLHNISLSSNGLKITKAIIGSKGYGAMNSEQKPWTLWTVFHKIRVCSLCSFLAFLILWNQKTPAPCWLKRRYHISFNFKTFILLWFFFKPMTYRLWQTMKRLPICVTWKSAVHRRGAGNSKNKTINAFAIILDRSTVSVV